jgi:hypothetical protein
MVILRSSNEIGSAFSTAIGDEWANTQSPNVWFFRRDGLTQACAF